MDRINELSDALTGAGWRPVMGFNHGTEKHYETGRWEKVSGSPTNIEIGSKPDRNQMYHFGHAQMGTTTDADLLRYIDGEVAR